MNTSEEYRADYTVKQVADGLRQQLQRYLEAQYHARDVGVIEERRALLEETGTIGQEPYLETTPTYKLADPYKQLDLPPIIRDTLAELSTWNPGIGVFEHPYIHQSEALKAFFNKGQDLIVATGTGSGKTEIFLCAILGQVLREAGERPKSFKHPGFRALILYPMNALVSDQVSRLRRLFGHERLRDLFQTRFGRFPRFGMYTSRTPYPGPRTSVKDGTYMRPMLRYYLNLELDALTNTEDDSSKRLVKELKERGKWPAKDLEGFYGQEGGRWEKRLKTQAGDRELLMRHEIQAQCPDILVTNYSMLEYMLLRPIERNIFRQTREWLETDKENMLVLVLDEAHMYRGVGGAEVAFLIRRLQARLGIPRDRMRCILTSASLESRAEAEEAVRKFAIGLTGSPSNKSAHFSIIRGEYEELPRARVGTAREAEQLACFDLPTFFRRVEAFQDAEDAVRDLATKLGWAAVPITPPDANEGEENAREFALRKYLYEQLKGFGPLQYLISNIAGRATALAKIADSIFPGIPQAEIATEALLALGAYAHNGERVLMPTRVHLFFRGLPSLYACINPRCEQRRYKPGEELLLGRLYTEPRTHCTCAMKARVYELYGHRECGASFLRVFTRGEDRNFYWHEQGGNLENVGQPLDEDLLLIGKLHDNVQKKAEFEPIYLDMKTGRVSLVDKDSNHRLLYRAIWNHETQSSKSRGNGKKRTAQRESDEGETEEQSKLKRCPACDRRSVDKIMGFATVGEQSFANLVSEQLMLQPITKKIDSRYPNGGRKVLLFSDGRQKAARLARDLPREVEFDSFRMSVILAASRLEKLGREPKLDNSLYTAFISVCHDFSLPFFDQEDRAQEKLLDDRRLFQKHYDGKLLDALDDNWIVEPPVRYKKALLRQLSDPYYSLYTACAAAVQPSKTALRLLKRSLTSLPQEFLETDLEPTATAWIQELLERVAFDPSFNHDMRYEIREFFKPLARGTKFSKIENVLRAGELTENHIKLLNEGLYDALTDQDSGSSYLKPSQLSLVIALDNVWLQCMDCGLTHFVALMGYCPSCGSKRLEERAPSHPYMISRKGYFLEPIRQVLSGARPVHLTAEEHTAQLSHRDTAEVYATTEEYELRFQDVPLKDTELKIDKPPIDVLSCTTTMEVGIDIGSLTAVGLRNVPPQRENYQQRAGRAGRRGASVSSVITYSQGGPHDSYYYENPSLIISGPPREPKVKIDNQRIARRHINSFLIQTFFHQQLDRMSSEDRQVMENTRGNILSAFGFAIDFFANDAKNQFTLDAFEKWIGQKVLGPKALLLDSVVSWLPDEICANAKPNELHTAKREFTVDMATKFIRDLKEIAPDYFDAKNNNLTPSTTNQSVANENAESEEEYQASLLIDVLFDNDILPAYAFPTNLCTFYVFDRNKNGRVVTKERPQQGKDKALSEYAPGRLLVINKQTYRVGGVYVEGTPTGTPLKSYFEKPLEKYVYCPTCTYVRLGREQSAGMLCPICTSQLRESEFLDPPGFSPERGKALSERERNQEISYATYAQLPTPINPEDFEWRADLGTQMRHAYRESQRLVIVNKGPEKRGFRICESCGACWPENEAPTKPQHQRPFQIENYVLQREGLSYWCNGPLRPESIYLGFTFLTDLLMIRVALQPPLGYNPAYPSFHDALQTSAEALALAASRRLDIDPGELSAGYRLMPSTQHDNQNTKGLVDIFLYDTASGGAGYAAEAGELLGAIIDDAITLLQNCPGQCDRSCTKCLRHYGNRILHERLDRKLAAQVLYYAKTGIAPAIFPATDQARQLASLRRFLELEGWQSEQSREISGVQVPILISPNTKGQNASRQYAVGTYPALLDPVAEGFDHPLYELDGNDKVRVILLSDYIVDRDLPTAYHQLLAKMRV